MWFWNIIPGLFIILIFQVRIVFLYFPFGWGKFINLFFILEKWERINWRNGRDWDDQILTSLWLCCCWFNMSCDLVTRHHAYRSKEQGWIYKKKKRRMNKKKDTKVGNLTTHMVVKEYLSKVNIIDIQDFIYYFLSWMISTSFIFIAFYNSKF